MRRCEYPVVGPRDLPAGGTVEVWADGETSPNGRWITVPVNDLRESEVDAGQGVRRLYALHMSSCRGDSSCSRRGTQTAVRQQGGG